MSCRPAKRKESVRKTVNYSEEQLQLALQECRTSRLGNRISYFTFLINITTSWVMYIPQKIKIL